MNNVRKKQLDQVLRTISPSEQKYRQGIKYDFIKDTRLNTINHTNQINTYGFKGIYIKKNSRFNEIPMHSHSLMEIGIVYSGNIQENIQGHMYDLHQGQIVLIDKNTSHAIGYAQENDILISVLVSDDIIQDALSRSKSDNLLVQFFLNAVNQENHTCNYLIFNSEDNDRLQSLILEFLYENYFPSPESVPIKESLFIDIILNMMPDIDTKSSFISVGRSSQTMMQALAYINANYQDCTLTSTAAYLGIHPAYLSSLLHHETGRTFKEIITQKKMHYASELLTGSEFPIDVIADKAGYSNLTFFYKKFAEQYHCTPKEYREKTSPLNHKM